MKRASAIGDSVSRRIFLAASLAAAAARARGAKAAVRRRGIPLGFDNFAVRALGWNAQQLVDHAASLACDSVFITDFGPFAGKTDDAALTGLPAARWLDATVFAAPQRPFSAVYSAGLHRAPQPVAAQRCRQLYGAEGGAPVASLSRLYAAAEGADPLLRAKALAWGAAAGALFFWLCWPVTEI
jgi:hypothetical protein